MKKLLSIALAVVMLMSISVMASSAADTNQVIPYASIWYSSQPYENVSGIGVMVYGYLGDADGDKDISVMDATEIQLYCARLTTLNSNAQMVSDTDADGEISVMDATEIQLWAASLPANDNISHTVYIKQSATTTSDGFYFDKTVEYVKANGQRDEEFGYYSLSHLIDPQQPLSDIFFLYMPDDNVLTISKNIQDASDMSITSCSFTFFKGNPVFDFFASKATFTEGVGVTYLYDIFGKAEITNQGNFTFVIDESSVHCAEVATYDYADVKDTITSEIKSTMKMVTDLVN